LDCGVKPPHSKIIFALFGTVSNPKHFIMPDPRHKSSAIASTRKLISGFCQFVPTLQATKAIRCRHACKTVWL
jgi:hypothetical protein